MCEVIFAVSTETPVLHLASVELELMTTDPNCVPKRHRQPATDIRFVPDIVTVTLLVAGPLLGQIRDAVTSSLKVY